MFKNWYNIFWVVLVMVTGCQTDSERKYPDVTAPVAAVKPFEIISRHGHSRMDNYYWLNNREDQEVISYLEAENKYLDTMLAHTRLFQEKLYEEMKARIKEKDESVPYKLDNFYYYTRFEEGYNYPVYCRKKGSLDAMEEILADGNKLGENQSYFNFYLEASPEHDFAHLVMDTVGRNFYAIRFKNLNSGEMLKDVIHGSTGNVEWANDNKTVFYGMKDPETLRSYRVYKHRLGTPQDKDVLVYEETDSTLAIGFYKSRSKKYIILSSGRTDANYSRFFDADDPDHIKLTVVEPLQANVDYNVDHFNNKFFIYTNLGARNYRLVEAPVENPGSQSWKDVVPHREDIFLRSTELFRDYLALGEESEGLTRIRLIKWSDQSENIIDFGEPAYIAYIDNNPDPNTHLIRYGYQSMTTPASVYDYNMESREKLLKKQQEVLGGFSAENYQTERFMVTARDGANVPVSLVYNKNLFKRDGTNPGLIYGYGSYGSTMYASFNSSRLSLLDRGFVFAIAHVRGGQEMGGKWYEEGKMFKKKNTFYDFIDCSKYLMEQKYVGEDKLFAQGGSAGGLLMGAVSNLAPELYKGMIAAVPFVDVITTMMDESIPLTTFEWLEWGNPHIQEEYEYMLSYSPYDNVEAKSYPNLLVTTGLHDSQVQYWEPAKWVAKLRATKTDNHYIFLYTNMEAGHGGASGRFRRLKETALQYTFMFDLLNISE